MIKKCAKILAALCAGCLILISGCMASDTDSGMDDTLYDDMHSGGENYIVAGFSQVGSESDWRNVNTESFKSVFTTKNGYYLLYEDAQQKQENQIKAVRDFILQDVDYIILDPIVETGWDAVLMEAKDAGIPVIVVDRRVVVEDEGLYTCWIGSDFVQEGAGAGKWLEDYLQKIGRTEEEIHIVTLQGTIESTAQIGRTAGFQEVLSEHKNWKMLESRSGEFTQAKAKEVMEYFLESYDSIDVLVSENDNMTFGAIEAIEEAGLTCGQDIIIISFDAVKEALQLMMDGKINVDFECNPMLGQVVLDVIERIEAGEQVDKIQYIKEHYFDSSMDLKKILEERTY